MGRTQNFFNYSNMMGFSTNKGPSLRIDIRFF